MPIFSIFTFKPEYVLNISSADWIELSELSRNFVICKLNNFCIFFIKYISFKLYVSTEIVENKVSKSRIYCIC